MPLPKRMFQRFLSTTPSAQNTIQTRATPSKAHLAIQPSASSLPKGYLVGATHCGVKKSTTNPPKLDLGLILSTSPHPTACAASFTKNVFKAAPVVVSDEVLKKTGGYARGVVVNSGCANAVTGKQGLEDAWSMVKEAGLVLDSVTKRKDAEPGGKGDLLVMSTGVIGVNLPIEKIVKGIRAFSPSASSATLDNTPTTWTSLAHSFMTTDTFPKLRTRTFSINGTAYRIAGIDKGAGMIHPDMGPASTVFGAPGRQLHATLLGCIMTDAPVSPSSLQSALNYAVDRSFNSISVDGDMSTNDTVILLANGAAHEPASHGQELKTIDEQNDVEAYKAFRDELTSFAQELAQLVVRDGEGATKFVQVTVKGAPTYESAHAIASKISTSALVKTALYGEDANWGRILAATGSVPLSSPSSSSTPLTIDPTKVSVTFIPSTSLANQSPLPVLVNGEPCGFSEERAKEILSEEDFEVVVDLSLGKEEAKYWTCDLSYEYVRINGDYRS